LFFCQVHLQLTVFPEKSSITQGTQMKKILVLASLFAVIGLSACGKKETPPAPAPAPAPAAAPAAAPASDAASGAAPAAAPASAAPAASAGK
jgi:hypothetical protein